MLVVSNTSPLSALAIIGRLNLLRGQFGVIRIPPAVWAELSRLEHASGKQALEQAYADGWIQVHESTNLAIKIMRYVEVALKDWVESNPFQIGIEQRRAS